MPGNDHTPGAPDLEDYLRLVIGGELEALFGNLPAKVLSYDMATQSAEVQPLVMVVIEGEPTKLATSKDVPVRWPSAQSFALTAPLVAGDLGWIIPSGADIGAYIAAGTENNDRPDHLGRMDLSDVVFVPGGRPLVKALPPEAFSADGPVLFAETVIFLGDSTAVHKVALGGPLWDELVKLAGHKHLAGAITAPSGGGTCTGISAAADYSAPGSAADIQADKVKAK